MHHSPKISIRKRKRGKRLINVISLIEDLVADRYAEKFKRPFYVVRGYFKPFDVASLAGDILLEVKFDSKSVTTGNFAIEYSYAGNASGVAGTKADYMVLVVPKNGHLSCYEVDTRSLKEVLKNKYLIRGGDGNKSLMKLLPMSDLREIASDTFQLKFDVRAFQPYWK